jgi:hypothetical protein
VVTNVFIYTDLMSSKTEDYLEDIGEEEMEMFEYDADDMESDVEPDRI